MKEQTENNSNMDMKNFPTIHCLELFSVLFYILECVNGEIRENFLNERLSE